MGVGLCSGLHAQEGVSTVALVGVPALTPGGHAASRRRRPRAPDGRELSPVALHVYDNRAAAIRATNALLGPVGLGVFHCGLEVLGHEWSYSEVRMDPKSASGMYWCTPGELPGFYHLAEEHLGYTSLSEAEVSTVLVVLSKTWLADDYHLLRRNCYHFCDALAGVLGVSSVPTWVTNLAAVGSRLDAAASSASGACGCRRCVCDDDRPPGGFVGWSEVHEASADVVEPLAARR